MGPSCTLPWLCEAGAAGSKSHPSGASSRPGDPPPAGPPWATSSWQGLEALVGLGGGGEPQGSRSCTCPTSPGGPHTGRLTLPFSPYPI